MVYCQKKQRGKQKPDKTKQEEEKLPLHHQSGTAQYVPLYVMSALHSSLCNADIKSTKKKLKPDFSD